VDFSDFAKKIASTAEKLRNQSFYISVVFL
jgi:hypothetical protein